MIYRRNFQMVLAAVSFIGFALSLSVHFSSFLGVNILDTNSPYFFLLHIFIFIPFAILIAVSQPIFKLYKLTSDGNYQTWFFSPMPKWIKYAVYVLSVYVVLNFIFCLLMVSTVKAEILNGKYVLIPIKKEVLLQNVIREISPQEYELQTSYETRLFTGHWMLFYLMPALFFWYKGENPTWLASPNQHND